MSHVNTNLRLRTLIISLRLIERICVKPRGGEYISARERLTLPPRVQNLRYPLSPRQVDLRRLNEHHPAISSQAQLNSIILKA